MYEYRLNGSEKPEGTMKMVDVRPTYLANVPCLTKMSLKGSVLTVYASMLEAQTCEGAVVTYVDILFQTLQHPSRKAYWWNSGMLQRWTLDANKSRFVLSVMGQEYFVPSSTQSLSYCSFRVDRVDCLAIFLAKGHSCVQRTHSSAAKSEYHNTLSLT